MVLGAGLGRGQTSETDPPSQLVWTSAPLQQDLDIAGDIELRLEAVSTAFDTAWIVHLQDVDASGTPAGVTAGYLRASLREVDEANSRIGSPSLPCRTFQGVPLGEPVLYRIPLVSNARRFKAGHCVRLIVTSDDQNPDAPAMLGFRHASVGASSLNTIRSASRLMLPILTPST